MHENVLKDFENKEKYDLHLMNKLVCVDLSYYTSVKYIEFRGCNVVKSEKVYQVWILLEVFCFYERSLRRWNVNLNILWNDCTSSLRNNKLRSVMDYEQQDNILI